MTPLEEISKYLKAVLPERVAIIVYEDREMPYVYGTYHIEFHEKNKDVWHFEMAKVLLEHEPIIYIIEDALRSWYWSVWNGSTSVTK